MSTKHETTRRMSLLFGRSLLGCSLAIAMIGCGSEGVDGERGPAGVPGPRGSDGADGEDGQDGQDGQDGTPGAPGDPGAPGEPGTQGEQGPQGDPGAPGDPGPQGDPGAPGDPGPQGPQGDPGPTGVDPYAPLSSLVALSFQNDQGTGATTIPAFVKARVMQVAEGSLPASVQFPLAPASTDSVRAIAGVWPNVVIKWLDPLTYDQSAAGPRFGANADYVAFFGDGWSAAPGAPPQWNGSSASGWVWVNHEYISNFMPTSMTAPKGQHLTLAKHLQWTGALKNDVTKSVWLDADLSTYIHHYKKQLGGSWLRVVQDPATGEWEVDRAAKAVRYDGTSNTKALITGHATYSPDTDDKGVPLPPGVASGIMGDCAGQQTPWGTIITAEENVQDYYGDYEAAWTSQQKFVPGMGFDPGANIAPVKTASPASDWGRDPDPKTHHARDLYGYLVEIDPGVPSGEYEGMTSPGVGHKKIGAMGRARWENAAIPVDGTWKLLDNQPIVLYAGDDRRSGRIYKFVSSGVYTAGMTKPQIRALLDSGSLYVGHFAGLDNLTGNTLKATGLPPSEASPGAGYWLKLSVDSTDIAPNAAALGAPGMSIGDALKDTSYNGIGGFPTDDHVRRALFTASAKIGVMELNRPEDLEWNPIDPSGTPRVYIAFTNHARKTQLDQDGKLFDPALHDTLSVIRPDKTGAIFTVIEANPASPGTSTTFSYVEVWRGAVAYELYNAADPDNILIDKDGGVWFGTDGNFGTNAFADGFYYLDLDPAHKLGQPGITFETFGKAFRILGVPSDAELTGPAFSPDMTTLFFSVQHPGEEIYSAWPEDR